MEVFNCIDVFAMIKIPAYGESLTFYTFSCLFAALDCFHADVDNLPNHSSQKPCLEILIRLK